jgi:hypothetical protein
MNQSIKTGTGLAAFNAAMLFTPAWRESLKIN